MKYFVEGKSIVSGEVIYGRPFEAASEVDAISKARNDCASADRSLIEFEVREVSNDWRDEIIK